jgi:hypothetical protein
LTEKKVRRGSLRSSQGLRKMPNQQKRFILPHPLIHLHVSVAAIKQCCSPNVLSFFPLAIVTSNKWNKDLAAKKERGKISLFNDDSVVSVV